MSARELAEAALTVSDERSALLDDLRRALLEGRQDDALRYARRLTGLEEEHGEGDRPDPRVH